MSNIKRDKNNKGAVLLNEEEQKFIYSKVNAVKDDTVKGNTAHFLSEIQFLRTQLENKDTQILQMQNLLDQQQRLSLQDKKLLDEYKSEINDLKALKMPSQDTKVEQVSSKQPQEVESVAEEPKKAPRKWWKLW